jgi:hypothetical protein
VTDPLIDQVGLLVSENQHLRVKSDNDDKTLHLMREQYDALSSSVEGLRDRHERETHKLRTERDQAVRKYAVIKALLMQSADITMQALRAEQGDETPEVIPDRVVRHVSDDRLPIARLS